MICDSANKQKICTIRITYAFLSHHYHLAETLEDRNVTNDSISAFDAVDNFRSTADKYNHEKTTKYLLQRSHMDSQPCLGDHDTAIFEAFYDKVISSSLAEKQTIVNVGDIQVFSGKVQIDG
jgi:hypothetical protein